MTKLKEIKINWDNVCSIHSNYYIKKTGGGKCQYSQACVASLSYSEPGEVKEFRLILKPDEEYINRWYLQGILDSDHYKDCFLVHDLDWCLKYGFPVNLDMPRNLVMSGISALRQIQEFGLVPTVEAIHEVTDDVIECLCVVMYFHIDDDNNTIILGKLGNENHTAINSGHSLKPFYNKKFKRLGKSFKDGEFSYAENSVTCLWEGVREDEWDYHSYSSDQEIFNELDLEKKVITSTSPFYGDRRVSCILNTKDNWQKIINCLRTEILNNDK